MFVGPPLFGGGLGENGRLQGAERKRGLKKRRKKGRNNSGLGVNS